MSFRKRSVGLSSPSTTSQKAAVEPEVVSALGVRPSPLDGRPTTSSGTASLDSLFGGHAGLALGNSLLLEESGTTEYSGTLLRFYAAEGVLHGHQVHAIGVGEQWGRELPGVARLENDTRSGPSSVEKEKMKIAWRYERLGDFGTRASPSTRASVAAPRDLEKQHLDKSLSKDLVFCHSFDLTKRLSLPDPSPLNFIPISSTEQNMSPFSSVIQSLTQELNTSPTGTIHRLVIPNILSPALYPSHSSNPHFILQFLHSLRALLRQHSARLTAMITLPLLLYPRSTGLVRWMELVSDGVIELIPFPHSVEFRASTATGAATAQEEKPQGIVQIHRLPVFSEKGGGVSTAGDDLAFTASRRKFVIKPFSLPPVEGDIEAQRGEGEGKPKKVTMEF
ncbi:MAG: hypothetical protein Q9214_005299 [Letrouitia sp. 1 TL-2023]